MFILEKNSFTYAKDTVTQKMVQYKMQLEKISLLQNRICEGCVYFNNLACDNKKPRKSLL